MLLPESTSPTGGGRLGRAPRRCRWFGLSLTLLAVVSSAPAQGYRPAPGYAQVGLPDAAAARAILDRFRGALNSASAYLEFELHALPRRGDERVYHGRLWTGRNERGPIARIELTGADGRPHRLLVQGGAQAAVWADAGTGVAAAEPSALMAPLLPGVETSAFDVEMPFLYWADARLVSVERVRGRPAYAFLFTPAADFAAAHPEVASVRAFLDAEFDAPVQFEILGRNGRAAQTWSLLNLKKAGDRWIPQEIDVRNEATRDKTRFIATGVAPGWSSDPAIFEPAHLTDAVPPPPAAQIIGLSS
jgi:hypothetical protein